MEAAEDDQREHDGRDGHDAAKDEPAAGYPPHRHGQPLEKDLADALDVLGPGLDAGVARLGHPAGHLVIILAVSGWMRYVMADFLLGVRDVMPEQLLQPLAARVNSDSIALADRPPCSAMAATDKPSTSFLIRTSLYSG